MSKKMKRLPISLTPGQHAALKAAAKNHNASMSYIINGYLDVIEHFNDIPYLAIYAPQSAAELTKTTVYIEGERRDYVCNISFYQSANSAMEWELLALRVEDDVVAINPETVQPETILIKSTQGAS